VETSDESDGICCATFASLLYALPDILQSKTTGFADQTLAWMDNSSSVWTFWYVEQCSYSDAR
jgi:hypothetical protein